MTNIGGEETILDIFMKINLPFKWLKTLEVTFRSTVIALISFSNPLTFHLDPAQLLRQSNAQNRKPGT